MKHKSVKQNVHSDHAEIAEEDRHYRTPTEVKRYRSIMLCKANRQAALEPAPPPPSKASNAPVSPARIDKDEIRDHNMDLLLKAFKQHLENQAARSRLEISDKSN